MVDPDVYARLQKSAYKKKKKPRSRNLSGWRTEVVTRDGGRCRACGKPGGRDGAAVSAHHLIFKSHCRAEYIDDPRNGLTLCNSGPTGIGDGCHQKVHAGRLKISRRMLPPDVRECLAEQGLTWTDDDGPVGTLARYFE